MVCILPPNWPKLQHHGPVPIGDGDTEGLRIAYTAPCLIIDSSFAALEPGPVPLMIFIM